ncbi:hypothetical protein TI39_contig669g00007 [Zymoseptoria brevis]|uniref:Uncharacterized protein n=1 Tax=Zymoseptoria brevis TaxID=1047168 RepID=A0A0F4GGD5_9PEZI|nr:hypothetical protein TI39_contig669g00007 [Zymoseptoria brevis]
MDWMEVRMFQFVDQTGGYDLWKGTTNAQRSEAYKTILKQFPVSIFTGLLGASTAAHLDLGSIWGNHDDHNLARQKHSGRIFGLLCESTFLYVVKPLAEGQRVDYRSSMRAAGRKGIKTMVYTDAGLFGLNPRLGGLGDIPFLGFGGGSEDDDVAALMIAQIAGAERNVSQLFAPTP